MATAFSFASVAAHALAARLIDEGIILDGEAEAGLLIDALGVRIRPGQAASRSASPPSAARPQRRSAMATAPAGEPTTGSAPKAASPPAPRPMSAQDPHAQALDGMDHVQDRANLVWRMHALSGRATEAGSDRTRTMSSALAGD